MRLIYSFAAESATVQPGFWRRQRLLLLLSSAQMGILICHERSVRLCKKTVDGCWLCADVPRPVAAREHRGSSYTVQNTRRNCQHRGRLLSRSRATPSWCFGRLHHSKMGVMTEEGKAGVFSASPPWRLLLSIPPQHRTNRQNPPTEHKPSSHPDHIPHTLQYRTTMLSHSSGGLWFAYTVVLLIIFFVLPMSVTPTNRYFVFAVLALRQLAFSGVEFLRRNARQQYTAYLHLCHICHELLHAAPVRKTEQTTVAETRATKSCR